MRRFLLLLMLVVGVQVAVAQNSDLSMLLGGSPATRWGMQVNYAWQVWERPIGRLYLELPVTIPVAPPDEASNQRHIFVTPGIRYHFNVTHRVALYAAAGIGFEEHANVGTARFAYDFGVGIDYRLSSRWSLRGDLRDVPLGTQQDPFVPRHRHNIPVMVGFALHF